MINFQDNAAYIIILAAISIAVTCIHFVIAKNATLVKYNDFYDSLEPWPVGVPDLKSISETNPERETPEEVQASEIKPDLEYLYESLSPKAKAKKFVQLTENTKCRHPVDSGENMRPWQVKFLNNYKKYNEKFGEPEKFEGFGRYSSSLPSGNSDQGNDKSKCESYLSDGSWGYSDFTRNQMAVQNENESNQNIFQNIHFNPNTTYKQDLNQNGLIRWEHKTNCQNKVYKTEEIHKCLKENYKTFQIYGDSRARQYWDVVRSILSFDKNAGPEYKIRSTYEDIPTNGYFMNDGHWPPPTFYTDDENDPNSIKIRHDSYLSPIGVKEHLQTVYKNNNKPYPKVIIIMEQVLHQLRINMSDIYVSETEKVFRNELMPFLKEITTNSPDTIVIFYSCEYTEVNGFGEFEFQHDVDEKNEKIKYWNDLLEELVPNLDSNPTLRDEKIGKNNKIFRISANLKTALSPLPDKTLMTEGIHLGWKRVGNIVVAQPLLVDVNIMLNLICNRFDETSESANYCCSNVF